MNKEFIQNPSTEKGVINQDPEKNGLNKKLWKKNILVVIGIICVSIMMFIGFFALYVNHYIHSKNNQKQETELIITDGEKVQTITKDLETKNLIKHDLLFVFYLKYKGLSNQLVAGEYRLQAGLTPLQIIDILTNGKVASRKITIPEGWTISEIGAYLEKNKIVTKKDFIAATKEKYTYDFLSTKPTDIGLEGYLFPDTYQVSYKATARDVVDKMLKNFDKKLTSQLKSEIAGSGMNLHEIITLASIVEKEANKTEDRKIVAGIFLSRLKESMPLQSDVTVLYALGVNKKTLTTEETKIVSPYNTYLNVGLPIGPISNPGMDSIDAVLNPQITQYRYFLAANDVVYYSKTLAEHQEKVAKYLQ